MITPCTEVLLLGLYGLIGDAVILQFIADLFKQPAAALATDVVWTLYLLYLLRRVD